MPALNASMPKPYPKKRTRVARVCVRSFTLIELLAAMVVLLILMSFLTEFLFSAQRVWALSNSTVRIYENAQVVFDVISSDLRSAVASDEENYEIGFYQWEHNPSVWCDNTDWQDRRLFSFVSGVEGPSASADLSEIRYELYTGADLAHVDAQYRLRRIIDSDNSTNWDFLGAPDAGWTRTATDAAAHTITDGVRDISFACYPYPAILPGTNHNYLPQAVRVNLTLFNPKYKDAPAEVRDRTMRTFSKLILLERDSSVGL